MAILIVGHLDGFKAVLMLKVKLAFAMKLSIFSLSPVPSVNKL